MNLNLQDLENFNMCIGFGFCSSFRGLKMRSYNRKLYATKPLKINTFCIQEPPTLLGELLVKANDKLDNHKVWRRTQTEVQSEDRSEAPTVTPTGDRLVAENASLMLGVRGQKGQAGWRPQKGNSNLNTQSKVRRIWAHSTLKVEVMYTHWRKKKFSTLVWNLWKMHNRDTQRHYITKAVEAYDGHFLTFIILQIYQESQWVNIFFFVRRRLGDHRRANCHGASHNTDTVVWFPQVIASSQTRTQWVTTHGLFSIQTFIQSLN